MADYLTSQCDSITLTVLFKGGQLCFMTEGTTFLVIKTLTKPYVRSFSCVHLVITVAVLVTRSVQCLNFTYVTE